LVAENFEKMTQMKLLSSFSWQHVFIATVQASILYLLRDDIN